MTDDNSPSASASPISASSNEAESGAQKKHKVIADIHTGMVLVAPIENGEVERERDTSNDADQKS